MRRTPCTPHPQPPESPRKRKRGRPAAPHRGRSRVCRLPLSSTYSQGERTRDHTTRSIHRSSLSSSPSGLPAAPGSSRLRRWSGRRAARHKGPTGPSHLLQRPPQERGPAIPGTISQRPRLRGSRRRATEHARRPP